MAMRCAHESAWKVEPHGVPATVALSPAMEDVASIVAESEQDVSAWSPSMPTNAVR
jgi:hypothetical protein